MTEPLLLDTSAAIPLVLAGSTSHEVIRDRVLGHPLGLAGHAELETFSVLTRLPREQRLSPAAAARVIAHNFPQTRHLDRSQQAHVLQQLAALGISGGSVWDGLVGLAALAADLLLVTRDRRAAPTYGALGCRFELAGD